FVVAAHVDPGPITLKFNEAKKLRVTGGGDLLATTSAGDFRLRRPQAYQEIAGVRKTISSRFKLRRGHLVQFEIGRYDRDYALVIDPVLVFATYVGGSGNTLGNAIALDQDDNIYIAGTTSSTSFGAGNETPA